VNYEERRGRGLWVASTRVEKWNDLSVADRCKHRGMSWTGQGVLSVALYAATQKDRAGTETEQAPQAKRNYTQAYERVESFMHPGELVSRPICSPP
jgi:hypothetical protein